MSLLISIVGPTAAGKSNVAVQLAQALGCPVVSADSVQVYRGLDIGSGKLTTAEMQGVPHYMLDILDPGTVYSAAEYGAAVDVLLKELFEVHPVVLLVGGSGFYVSAVWEGLDAMPGIPEAVRQQLRNELAEKGLAPLVDELERVDPTTWARIDRQNPVRVLRALEVQRASGLPMSHFQQGRGKEKKAYSELRIGIELPRAELYARIEARVQVMLAQGWLDELKALVAAHGADCPALQSLGYRELLAYLQGQESGAGTPDWPSTVALIQQNTRRYAKRQWTWFRRYADIQWHGPDDLAAIRRSVEAALR